MDANSDQFRRYLAKQGCTFEPGRGGHLNIARGDRKSFIRVRQAARHRPDAQDQEGFGDRVIPIGSEDRMYDYPVKLTPDDNDTVLVTFVDLPGATSGEDEQDALDHAVDGLETMLNAYMADRQDIPAPSPANGRPTVAPTLLGALKLSVYQAMRARGWRKADLARSMGLNPRQIDRLLDLRHASTVAQLDQAMWVCGQRFDVAGVERQAA
ncbi:type II toxin-antitoxin system HicB family antitoxin [Sphingomonas sp.]|uniref:type II toxin-antitoxin system HicB family antitoxin n=1 Tax=Sphingomonas sp. TaxID=28214 RepID=UPI002ED7BF82